jgi:hypothetical protein
VLRHIKVLIIPFLPEKFSCHWYHLEQHTARHCPREIAEEFPAPSAVLGLGSKRGLLELADIWSENLGHKPMVEKWKYIGVSKIAMPKYQPH